MKRNEKGFTLIELLVVMAIIGILAAIAIPNFKQYRARGFDARAKSDLYNAATAEEAYFIANETYLTCQDAGCVGGGGLEGLGGLSAGVSLSLTANQAGDAFTGNSNHASGTGAVCLWDSASGGFQPSC